MSHSLPNSAAEFTPVRTRRAFEEICVQIRREVQAGNLKPGDKLPAERELAARFQVSRSSVREALRALEIVGVVTLQRGARGGAVIQEGSIESITHVMQDLLFLGGFSLEDFTEARVCLQREVVRLACDRATEEDFKVLEENVAKTAALRSPEGLMQRTELTLEFYSLLAAATGNKVLCALMSAITDPLRDYITRLGPDRSWDVAASRSKFLEHLRARDSESAVAEMVSHMTRLHQYLLAQMQQGDS